MHNRCEVDQLRAFAEFEFEVFDDRQVVVRLHFVGEEVVQDSHACAVADCDPRILEPLFHEDATKSHGLAAWSREPPDIGKARQPESFCEVVGHHDVAKGNGGGVPKRQREHASSADTCGQFADRASGIHGVIDDVVTDDEVVRAEVADPAVEVSLHEPGGHLRRRQSRPRLIEHRLRSINTGHLAGLRCQRGGHVPEATPNVENAAQGIRSNPCDQPASQQ